MVTFNGDPALNIDTDEITTSNYGEYMTSPIQAVTTPGGMILLASEKGTTILSPDGSSEHFNSGFAGTQHEEGN